MQRFAAWRSGGFLAQKFNRRTALEPTTKLSYEALNPPLRQTAVSSSGSVFVRHFDSFKILNAPCPTMKNTIVPTIRSGYFEFVK